MTVVVGAISKSMVFLASDGYALYQTEDDQPVYKLDTYGKVRLAQNGKLALGFAGSHEISLQFYENIGEKLDVVEEAFLSGLANDLEVINKKDEHKKAAVILGYHYLEFPRIVLLPIGGGFEIQNKACAIGSGADTAIEYMSNYWNDDMSVSQSVSTIIECIYSCSIIPTVNFLPMIIILTRDKTIDLSQKTILEFEKFKNTLKEELVSWVKSQN